MPGAGLADDRPTAIKRCVAKLSPSGARPRLGSLPYLDLNSILFQPLG